MVLARFDKSKQRHYLVHFNGDPRTESAIRAKTITLSAGLSAKYKEHPSKIMTPTLICIG